MLVLAECSELLGNFLPVGPTASCHSESALPSMNLRSLNRISGRVVRLPPGKKLMLLCFPFGNNPPTAVRLLGATAEEAGACRFCSPSSRPPCSPTPSPYTFFAATSDTRTSHSRRVPDPESLWWLGWRTVWLSERRIQWDPCWGDASDWRSRQWFGRRRNWNGYTILKSEPRREGTDSLDVSDLSRVFLREQSVIGEADCVVDGETNGPIGHPEHYYRSSTAFEKSCLNSLVLSFSNVSDAPYLICLS